MAKLNKGTKKIISSGISSLDNSLQKGGFEEGSIILFIGDASSRKDLFGYQFLLEGLRNNESVIFYDVEASSDEIYDLISNSKKPETKGHLDFVNACPEYSKFYINAVPAKIIDHLKHKKKVKRVLINPLTFFIESFGIKDAGDFLIFIREIAMKRNLVVVFLLADILGTLEIQSIIDKVDGIIELKTEHVSNEIIRSMLVKKIGIDQKEIVLSYFIRDNNITITSTGRIM